ncbi:hypothetical protein DFJ74DRAFT_713023 [Hyaloraphidium curvatum]|nr:hypothetical protein DFJ74DRAFT_713023 [Hyaloraphidium curvatum]
MPSLSAPPFAPLRPSFVPLLLHPAAATAPERGPASHVDPLHLGPWMPGLPPSSPRGLLQLMVGEEGGGEEEVGGEVGGLFGGVGWGVGSAGPVGAAGPRKDDEKIAEDLEKAIKVVCTASPPNAPTNPPQTPRPPAAASPASSPHAGFPTITGDTPRPALSPTAMRPEPITPCRPKPTPGRRATPKSTPRKPRAPARPRNVESTPTRTPKRTPKRSPAPAIADVPARPAEDPVLALLARCRHMKANRWSRARMAAEMGRMGAGAVRPLGGARVGRGAVPLPGA